MTAALEIGRRGGEVVVYEADERVGGLARSFDLWGQRVDLGPHRFFSSDRRVNQLWLDVVGRDYRMVDRRTEIYYDGRFFDYPLRPANALANMGPLNAAWCVASYAKEKLVSSVPKSAEGSFEAWVVKRFGRRLFEMFFKSYSEKLWGISCRELDADFAAQRIQKFSLGQAIRGALFPARRGGHKTLVDRFAYPLGGTGAVYEKMAQRVRAAGGRVALRTPVKRVVNDGFAVRGLELADGRFESCDHVVSTMPLTLLVRGLGNVPPEVQMAVDALRFRNTIIVYLNVDRDRLFPDQWLYIHSPTLAMGRVTNFRNWVPELCGHQPTTILAVEFWCYEEDPQWRQTDDELIERATREMAMTGLLGDATVLAGHVVRIPRCYPVYARGYKQHVERIADWLRRFEGLTAIGRYGAFKYNNQDHSILMGILAAENLLANRRHDLWAINTDYDSYQEASVITETGLVAEPLHS